MKKVFTSEEVAEIKIMIAAVDSILAELFIAELAAATPACSLMAGWSATIGRLLRARPRAPTVV